MKKIIGILICLMLVLTGSTAFAATNWIKNADIPQWHESNWDEFAEADWTVHEYVPGIEMYYWNDTTETYGQSINEVSDTNRGYVFYLTIFNQSNQGLVFGHIGSGVNDSWIIVPSYTDNKVYITHHTGSGHLSLASEVTNTFQPECNITEDEPYIIKAIYNRYVGQLQYKIWDAVGGDEPLNWTIDITDSSLIRTQSTQWGLFAVQDVPTCFAMFAYFFVTELPYDTVGGIPTIVAPDLDYYAIVDSLKFEDAPTEELFADWSSIDLSVVEIYTATPGNGTNDNMYVFSGWDSSLMRLGVYIQSCFDITNDTDDAGMMILDMNHNHIADAGDKGIEWITTDFDCATHNGTTFIGDSTNWATVEANYTHSLQMFRDTRTWFINIDLEALFGSEEAVWDFIESNDKVGLSIITEDEGGLTLSSWNNWDRETNTSRTDFYNATFVPTWYGHLGLSGVRPEEPEPEYVDLTDFEAGALENDIVTYDSMVWNVPRYVMKTSDMLDNNVTSIKIPTNITRSAFFGLITSDIVVKNVIFYGITVKTFSVVDITSKMKEKHDNNYTIKESDLEDYDIIVVIPNPSTFDTSMTWFKWLYKDDVMSVW